MIFNYIIYAICIVDLWLIKMESKYWGVFDLVTFTVQYSSSASALADSDVLYNSIPAVNLHTLRHHRDFDTCSLPITEKHWTVSSFIWQEIILEILCVLNLIWSVITRPMSKWFKLQKTSQHLYHISYYAKY